MPAGAHLLPPRRTELVISPLGDRGRYVVKDPRAGAYYQLGEEEHFLLTRLDGRHDAGAVRAAFAARFGQPLGEEELDDFLEMVRAQGLLEESPPPATSPPAPADALGWRLLHWRKSLFDPDRLFTWLEPRLRFLWTTGFLVFSAACIVLAVGVAWTCRGQMAGSFRDALRWETAVWAWLALLFVTTCHEFAHGLTCKHHGGEVHEVGFLLLFFMPCFYCNVSDAWLFPQKSRRLWVTFAGGYFELFLWALAVFAWRLALPGTTVHYLAFVVLSACGVQTLLNFNPLVKLDGYYLLSDGAEVPNLHRRAAECLRAHARWLLWGAPRPAPEPRRRFLLLYGSASLLCSVLFLVLGLVGLARLAGSRLGWPGLLAAGLLTAVSVHGLAHGFSAGEVTKMLRLRHKRAAAWGLCLAAAAGLFLVPIEDRVGGPFQVRPATRAELRARVAGFIEAVYGDEGDRVAPGAVVVRLGVPDLASRLAQKRAEVREARARLRLLEAGPRPEEVAEHRQRVARARAWRDLAEQDLGRGRKALDRELARLDEQSAQDGAELTQARASLDRARQLLGSRTGRVISPEEYGEAEKRYQMARHRLEQGRDQRQARQALGTQEAEAELARREKELADARGALALLELGSRAEEVEAERARLARLEEEVHFLAGLHGKLEVTSPVAGVLTTPRLREKLGRYVKEGDLIGVVEDPGGLEAEIALAEQDAARVRVGQAIALKARSAPYETFPARVDRVAPSAARGEAQSTVTVYCRLPPAPESGGDSLATLGPEGGDGVGGLRPGMTGHARIATGRRSPGLILLDRALRYLRTEFWFWW
jgi:multidrug resistance efflux pump